MAVAGGPVSVNVNTGELEWPTSVGVASVAKAPPTNYWVPSARTPWTAAASTFDNQLKLVPVYLPAMTFNAMGLLVQTAGAGATALACLYAAGSNMEPGALVVGSASGLSLASTGFVSGSVSATTITEGWYWAGALILTGGASVALAASLGSGGSPAPGGFFPSTGTISYSATGQYRRHMDGQSSLPANASSATTQVVTAGYAPIVFFRGN